MSTTRRGFLGGAGAMLAAQCAARVHPQSAIQGVGPPPTTKNALDVTDQPVDLVIDSLAFPVNGRMGHAIAVNGSIPGRTIRLREGQEAVFRVHNLLAETTSIHWHGILLPPAMDGVPGVSFGGIPAGSTFTYRFPVRQSGTYWAHSHSGAQELLGLYFPLIIDPAEPNAFDHDRDHVVLLSDWSFVPPGTIISKLKKQSGYYNHQKRTLADFFNDVPRNGLRATVDERLSWSKMRMDPTDFADVTGFTYTYLMNGLPPAQNWTGEFHPGERVRLRFIAAGAMTYFDVRIPGLRMTVVQADGQNVRPIEIDEFRIAPGETFDVLVTPGDSAYTIFAEAMDRSGYTRGTLAPRPGMSAPVPQQRPRPVRTMADMGMGAMVMKNKAAARGMDTMGKAATGSTAEMASSKRASPAAATDMSGSTPMSGMDASGTGGRSQAASSGGAPQGGMDIAGKGMQGMGQAEQVRKQTENERAMLKGSDGMTLDGGRLAAEHGDFRGPSGAFPPGSTPVMHGFDTHGTGNSSAPMSLTNRLNEPGSGFEEATGHVLTYADLASLNVQPDTRQPGRAIELHITGNMERYMWSFDGKKYSEATTPIPFKRGERLRMILVNDTMMEHPIHLHGMWMELENGAGDHQPRKHTISVKPAERLSVAITPEEPGRWVMHCHLLLHMDMGMLRVVEVAGPDGMQS